MGTFVALLFIATTSIAVATPNGPWPDLGRENPVVGGGAEDAALLVAISDFDWVADIPGATDNADLWLRWLSRSRGIPLERIHRLYDADAVREHIIKEMDAAASKVGPGGLLWVVVITHGAPALSAKDVVLLGADVRSTASSVYSRGVSRSELLAHVPPNVRAIVALDACFSGRGYGDSDLVDDPLGPLVPVDMQGIEAIGGVDLLLGAQAHQFTGPLPGGERPAFSYLLLGAVTGWGDTDGNGRVSTKEAVSWVNGALNVTVEGRTQTPHLIGTGHIDWSVGRPNVPAPDPLDVAQEIRNRAADALRQGLLDAATKDWLEVLRADERDRPHLASQFLSRYEGAHVEYKGQTLPVEVPEVQAAIRLRDRAREPAPMPRHQPLGPRTATTLGLVLAEAAVVSGGLALTIQGNARANALEQGLVNGTVAGDLDTLRTVVRDRQLGANAAMIAGWTLLGASAALGFVVVGRF